MYIYNFVHPMLSYTPPDESLCGFIIQYNTIQFTLLQPENKKTIKVQNMHALATKGGPKGMDIPLGRVTQVKNPKKN